MTFFRYSWSWGSPDILPMFAKGATLNHMEADFYGAEFEDFSSSDPSDLDQWVFDKVKAFMDKQGQSEDLRRKLRQDKLILFLHLLGLDTNGHTNKPHSRMYDRYWSMQVNAKFYVSFVNVAIIP